MRAPAWVCGVLAGLATAAACHAPRTADLRQPAASQRPETNPADGAAVSLFITGQIHNFTEPCGCSSEPLGDVARIAALLKAAGERGLLLDAGGLRYQPLRLPAEKQRQARLKADFLEEIWRKLSAVVMIQPTDLAGLGGLSELASGVRLASNLSLPEGALPAAALKTEAVRVVGGVTLGVLGIADPEAGPWPPGVRISDPVVAAQQGLERLRGRGVQGVIALTGLRRDAARRLFRKVPGFDLVVAGGDPELTDGAEQAEQLGGALLVVPAVEGQRLVRVDLHLSQEGHRPVWTLRRTQQQEQQAAAALRQRRDLLRARMEQLRSDPQAEPAFVRTTASEIERLSHELSRTAAPAAAPGDGYVTVELLPIRRALPRDREVAGAMAALDRRIGEANLEGLSGPPPPPAGHPSFVGISACQGACHFHDDAVEFWQKTRHAQAFPTLVQVGKELSYDCVSCHAVGFDEPGGSNLWSLSAWQRGAALARPAAPDLRNVQCEVCHGPGSLHVVAPSKNPIPVARPTQERCLTCHTKDHSDTFDFVPYLRDILGPGHGAARRAELGSGPTGKELRSAALKKHSAAH